MKFGNNKNEYEIPLKNCEKYINYDHITCLPTFNGVLPDEYYIQYVIYGDQKLKPKNNSHFFPITESPVLEYFPSTIKKSEQKIIKELTFYYLFDAEIDFYFREITHSYKLYKLKNNPSGELRRIGVDSYYTHYSYHIHFNIEIQDIPIGKYNLEYVCQKYRYKTKFNVSIE